MSASILLSAIAASIAIPQSSSAFNDAAVAMRDGDGIAVVKLFVAPDRTVEDCRVISAGVTEVDRKGVCGKLIGRRAAKAAVAPDGQATYGTMNYVVGEIGFVGPTGVSEDLPFDVVLDVQSLPGGVRSKAVSLNVLLDQAGKVTHCEAAGGQGDNFVKAACASLGQQALEIRKSSKGDAVSYIANITVAFVTSQASL